MPAKARERRVSLMPNQGRVALVTGGATRIGDEIVRTLHSAGFDVAIHYYRSETLATTLVGQLNEERPESAFAVQGDLLDWESPNRLVEAVADARGRLDVLVNNASTFYATPLGGINRDHWRDLMGTNLRAPFFLAEAAAPMLRTARGCIVNLVDIHGFRPKKDFALYSMAKAANAMMVKTLAQELGPDVRVNGVAPGAILWPEHGMSDDSKAEILSRTALKRPGNAADIARTVRFLVLEADYITGQIVAVDGGRTVQQ